MSNVKMLRRLYEANISCGDIGEAVKARMLAEIAAAEKEEIIIKHSVVAVA